MERDTIPLSFPRFSLSLSLSRSLFFLSSPPRKVSRFSIPLRGFREISKLYRSAEIGTRLEIWNFQPGLTRQKLSPGLRFHSDTCRRIMDDTSEFREEFL